MSLGNSVREEKRQPGIALDQLGLPLRRIQAEMGVRRETAAAYRQAAGVALLRTRRLGTPLHQTSRPLQPKPVKVVPLVVVQLVNDRLGIEPPAGRAVCLAYELPTIRE